MWNIHFVVLVTSILEEKNILLWIFVWNFEAYMTLCIMVFIAYTFLYDENDYAFSLGDIYWKWDLLSMKFCLMCDDNRISVIKNWLKISIPVIFFLSFVPLIFLRGLRIQHVKGYIYIHYTRKKAILLKCIHRQRLLLNLNSYSWILLVLWFSHFRPLSVPSYLSKISIRNGRTWMLFIIVYSCMFWNDS